MGYAHREMRLFAGSVTSTQYGLRAIPSATTFDFLDVSGKGLLHWFLLRVRAAANSDQVQGKITVDGATLQPSFTFAIFSSYGFAEHTKPISLLKYAADGECTIMAFFPDGLVYNKSLKLSAGNGTGISQVTDCCFYITKFVK